MNVPYNVNELTLKILNGLEDEYSSLFDAIKARENSVSLEKLHEKLVIQED